MGGTGLLSKDTEFSYYKTSAYEVVPDLQEVPDMGGTPEKVEVTTLADGSKRYINGVKDYGDLEFKFLYDNSSATSSYRILKGLETGGAVEKFQVELPDGTKFQFEGQISVKLDSAKVNAPLTYTASIMLNTAITVVNPSA